MTNLIYFNARGTIFSIPASLLNKYPKSLLYKFCNCESNDIINGGIYVDVNPSCIEYIIDYYNSINYCLDVIDVFLKIDMNYLGISLENINIPYIMTLPIFKNKNISIDETVKHKYCNVHTTDNKIIIVNMSLFNNDTNYLKLILSGHFEDYVIYKNETQLDVWIGVSEKYMNKLLSIIRDGINWYYLYLTNSNIFFNNIEQLYNNNANIINLDFKKIYAIDNLTTEYDVRNYYQQNDDNLSDRSDENSVVRLIDNLMLDLYSYFTIIKKNINNILNHVNKSFKKIEKWIIRTNNFLQNLEKQNNNADDNYKLYLYLKHFGILNDNIEKQLKLRLARSNIIGNKEVEFFFNNDKHIFSQKQVELKSFSINYMYDNHEQINLLNDMYVYISKNTFNIVLNHIPQTTFGMSIEKCRIIDVVNLDSNLNEKLSQDFLEYILGIK